MKPEVNSVAPMTTKEVTLKENEERSYEKKHSFKDLSTRKHYPGIHSIAIIVNGAERDKLDFSLEK